MISNQDWREIYSNNLRESRKHWLTKLPKHILLDFHKAGEELRYIQSINPVQPGACYSNDSEVFVKYCKMQERLVYQSGFPLLAIDIENCRTIAERA